MVITEERNIVILTLKILDIFKVLLELVKLNSNVRESPVWNQRCHLEISNSQQLHQLDQRYSLWSPKNYFFLKIHKNKKLHDI